MAWRDNLAHCWDLEEASSTRVDHIGDRHLAPVATPGNATGLVGNAVSLVRASSQCLSVAVNTTLGFGSAFSLAFWFYLNSLPAAPMVLFSYATSLTAGQFSYYGVITAGNQLQVVFGAGFGGNITHSATLGTGAWHFCGVTHSTTALRLRVNADAWDSQTVGLGSGGGAPPFNIGATNSNANFLDGLVDQFMVWDTAKSDSEIDTDVYNGGAGVRCVEAGNPWYHHRHNHAVGAM